MVFLSVSAYYTSPGSGHPEVSHQVTAVLSCNCYPQYQHQSQCTIRHYGRLEFPVLGRPVRQHSLFFFPPVCMNCNVTVRGVGDRMVDHTAAARQMGV